EDAEGDSSQDQPDSIQSVAGHALRMLGLGPDRKVLGIYFQRRLFLAGAHPAGARHSCRLRPIEVGDRETVGSRAPGAARHGDDGLMRMALVVHGVIASQRVGTRRRPMTGSAKQSRPGSKTLDCFVAALLAMPMESGSRPWR